MERQHLPKLFSTPSLRTVFIAIDTFIAIQFSFYTSKTIKHLEYIVHMQIPLISRIKISNKKAKVLLS